MGNIKCIGDHKRRPYIFKVRDLEKCDRIPLNLTN